MDDRVRALGINNRQNNPKAEKGKKNFPPAGRFVGPGRKIFRRNERPETLRKSTQRSPRKWLLRQFMISRIIVRILRPNFHSCKQVSSQLLSKSNGLPWTSFRFFPRTTWLTVGGTTSEAAREEDRHA
jgi:hypothetical protein